MNGDRMDRGTDVFATLTWGLRRYVAVVLAMTLLLGVLLPLLLARRTEVFQATAQVGPNAKLELSNTAPLPRIAESVFTNGAVEQSIRALLHQSKGNIIPSKVQLIAAQDNLVLDVVASAPTPDEAVQIANTAAETFSLELNRYANSVSTFVVQHKAAFAKQTPTFAGGGLSILFGVFGGLLAGIALVGLLLVIRRPVVGGSTAEDVTGLAVIGRIRLPRHGPPTTTDGRAIGLLSRRLLATSASTINVAAPKHEEAEKLAGLMREVFGWMRGVPKQKRPAGQSASDLPRVHAPEGARAWITAPDDKSYTVLLVPVGLSTRRLRLFAEGHDTGAPTGIVLTTTYRGSRVKPATEG